MVALTRDECQTLLNLQGAEWDVPRGCWCEQEPGHNGKHRGLGQVVVVETKSQEWWIAFDDTGKREFLVTTACDTEDTQGEMIGGEGDLCTLCAGHDGEHNFLRLTGDWPLRAILAETDLDDGVEVGILAPHQRHNRALLVHHRLTPAAYLAVLNMRGAEVTYGQRSARHFLAEDTPDPQPQIQRVPAFTPGLGLAISNGYLAVVTDPPYQAHYLNDGPDITITLTELGRQVLRDIDEHSVAT